MPAAATPGGRGQGQAGGAAPAQGIQQLLQQQQQQQTAATASNSNYPVNLRPEVSAAEEIRAGETAMETNRNAGFTTGFSVSRTGIFNGQSAIIDLAGDSVSEMLIKDALANTFPS